jgi:beta-xylosidase
MSRLPILVSAAFCCLFAVTCSAQIAPSVPDRNNELSKVWVADMGNGMYKNPVLYADYSDPDIVRVGDDFYMTASSFNCVPGLPILHSNDLVNWSLVGHAITSLQPRDVFNKPQHGNGVWAPSIRYRNGEFYIYYGDPDYGIYLVKSRHAEGPWEEPRLVKAAKGWIDPCPFWDDDGNAYLVHAYAASRAGIKSILTLHKMNAEGTTLLDDGVTVFDGHDRQPTIEGPKMYKRNGYYYIFAPAGGVKNGWQTVLRSKNVFGPYEDRIVMEQGKSPINGPHQGAWIELASGESWFIHFQDRDAYGRVVLLQPMKWNDAWPLIGIAKNDSGKGEPVEQFRKPDVGRTCGMSIPSTSDEFNSDSMGLQWQWQANPQPAWAAFSGKDGCVRMNAVSLPEGYVNLWDAPNLLLQKIPGPEFTATAKVTCHLYPVAEKAGLVIMGTDYSYLAVTASHGKIVLSQTVCLNARDGGRETGKSDSVSADSTMVYLRVKVAQGAMCTFSLSDDGKEFTDIGAPFKAKAGKWIGAKIGLFCTRAGSTSDPGYADFDWFRVE